MVNTRGLVLAAVLGAASTGCMDFEGLEGDRPIKTNVPGIEISELFPLQAKIADKFSIVRSLHHDDGDHDHVSFH